MGRIRIPTSEFMLVPERRVSEVAKRSDGLYNVYMAILLVKLMLNAYPPWGFYFWLGNIYDFGDVYISVSQAFLHPRQKTRPAPANQSASPSST